MNREFHQPTRILRISNPDHELIESDGSKNESDDPINYEQQIEQQVNHSPHQNHYQPLTPEPDSMESVTINQPIVAQTNQNEKVPPHIDSSYINKPKPALPLEAQQFQNTENQHHNQDPVPDRSSFVVSPLHFNSSNSVLTNDQSRTSTSLATEFANQNTSKYAKVSYHLTNDPGMLKTYREAAEKTNDTATQLLFAKYLLETATLFGDTHSAKPTRHVGSMWGISPTGKSAKPQPCHVIQEEDDGTDRSKQLSTASGGKSSTVNVYQQRAGLQLTNPVNHKNNDKLKSAMLEEEGVKWIKRLAKSDVPEACYILAQWMALEQHGFRHTQRSKLMSYYQVAAKGGVPEAMYALAYMYEEDKESPATLLRYYIESSNQGYVNAIYVSSYFKLFIYIYIYIYTNRNAEIIHWYTFW
jgi:TPR repeat protein